MNSLTPQRGDHLVLPHGRLCWAPNGAVSILNRDGEPARAGDGIATDLLRILVGGVVAPRGVTARVTAPFTLGRGIEQGFGDSVDMTNWNVVVDDRVIVKVMGRRGDGDRSVRLIDAITRHAPLAVPTPIGYLRMSRPDGTPVIATMTEYIAGSTDGWSWAVDDAVVAVEHGTRSQWPRELGALVAQVHHALAKETTRDTGDVPPSPPQLLTRRKQLRQLIPGGGAAAQRLRARESALIDAIRRLPAPRTPIFSIHGDLHVGQVLRSPDGRLQLIDFDGDPQSSADHDAADAAVDVAHLLVSLDLIGAIVAKRMGADAPGILAWCDAARVDVLSGYTANDTHDTRPALLDLRRLPGLEAMQLCREFSYARDYLPRWQYAPDWAISHRLPADPSLENPPWTPPALSTT